MKRASYRDGIDWIALNDEPTGTDHYETAGMISVLLLAAIFGVTSERVATDVLRYREKVKA